MAPAIITNGDAGIGETMIATIITSINNIGPYIPVFNILASILSNKTSKKGDIAKIRTARIMTNTSFNLFIREIIII